MKKISLSVDVNLRELVFELAGKMNEDALFSFIRDLDGHAASWSLTLRLAQYFAGEKAKHDQEVREEADQQEA